jgi:hypothetical protein
VIHATLEQVKPPGVLSLGRLVYGELTSEDPTFFGTVSIPRLMHNNGSKTGSMLGCQLQINVPIASNVSDDNLDSGPLRIALGGTIEAAGMLTGDPTLSSVILVGDAAMTPRSFAWTGQKQ